MNGPIRILELRSVRGTGGGPEKTILLGAQRSDPTAFAVTVCYVRDARDAVFEIDSKAATLGVDYVEVVEKHSFDVTILSVLRRLVRDRGIHIVHAHEYKTNLLAVLLHRWEGTIPLTTAHGWTGHSRRERFLYYPADRQLHRLFPKVIAVSEDIRQELIRAGVREANVQTVLNGIDHRQFDREHAREGRARAALQIPAHAVVIGSVGRLEPQKRFDLLIDVFARLRQARPELVLVIAGDGSLMPALASQVERLGLGQSCRLLGQRSDIGALHHAFDLFVQSSDYEGTPNAVLEAMAFQTPVIATDVGGTSQLVRHGVDGLIVPANDPVALSVAIEQALQDGPNRTARVSSARHRVTTALSFDARMDAVERIYRELYDRHSSHAPRRVTAHP